MSNSSNEVVTDQNSISCRGIARTNFTVRPCLSADELKKYEEYFDASLYLCVGMIYLRDNPILSQPLQKEHLKHRLLGHFGSAPGQVFTWMHWNRILNKSDAITSIFVSGPGHGAPAVLSQCWLEGRYSEVYPEMQPGVDGLRKFFGHFSFPGGIGSHATPETPGSIHEGGELGYSISHAFGAVFDNPNLVAVTVVGDGEAETGPLATSWHSNKFINPKTDGAVLPVLHLNGYKINNPTILSRISHKELNSLFEGYGWKPYFVEGDDRPSMHQAMAAVMELAYNDILTIWQNHRQRDIKARAVWPMIILRTPKGWTGPKQVDGHTVEGFWRSHQVPITNAITVKEDRDLLEKWMRGYKPESVFPDGKLREDLLSICPKGDKRMSANPIANAGPNLSESLALPDFQSYEVSVEHPGSKTFGSMANLGKWLAEVIYNNPKNFRLFGPDETESNKLGEVYSTTSKVFTGAILPEDSDGGNLGRSGRVMEMLSEHTCEGWLEGYTLTGRHGLLNSYEPFIHIIDSMVNQHCKWIEKCLEVKWRQKVPSLNILLTSVVWRQDHNGFTHQDPGFLDVVANKSPEVVRIYLPPDGNCLLSTMDHCLRSRNYVNVVVADKQEHLQYLNMTQAVEHCTQGISIWPQFSNDGGSQPDLVIASAGDIMTQEAIAAISLLREKLPRLKIRYINVVDLFKLISPDEHPHGLSHNEWDNMFTTTAPVIFNFHSYPWLVRRLTFNRANSHRIDIHGYNEKGNIDTPLELAIRNGTDRFTLAISAIERLGGMGRQGQEIIDSLILSRAGAKATAYVNGVDDPELAGWAWHG